MTGGASANAPSLAREDIARGLRALGVRPGMSLVAHSSLRSFGRVEGGAAAVVAALKDAVTADGTLLLPTFNHDVPFREGGAGIFDPLVTPTINGAIPDHFWRLPGVRRSLDPTHPVAAWGRHAWRHLAGHHRTLTMGPRSPLGLLGAEGGYGLLLGVGYESNTYHHVVETTLGVPCLGRRTEAYPVRLPDGRVVMGRTWGWRERHCPLTDHGRYGRLLRERGLERVGMIGACRATLFRLQDCFGVVAEVLRTGMDGFPPCGGCPIRTRAAPQTVPSDWDEARQALAPDSVAWTY